MLKFKEMCKSAKPNVVYKKEIASMACDPVLVKAQTPRNMKQLRNLRYQHLHQSRISHDALYNLHELAYDVPGFVWKISTYPDLVCIIGLQEILEEADKSLLLQHGPQLLSYDTTFQLGDFYVSPLIFRHTLFQEKPCIPAMFLFHERKFTDTHKQLFHECVSRIPALKNCRCPLVTDKEKAIANAVKEVLLNISHVFCWNHILRDIRYWLRKHGAPAADIAVYIEDVSSLFHSANEEVYSTRLAEYRRRWDAQFEEYYTREIHPMPPAVL